MNILFISLGEFEDLNTSSVHIDVVRELAKKNDVYLVCKSEKNKRGAVGLSEEYGVHVLRVRTGAIKTSNFIIKGISTLTVETIFKNAIARNLQDIHFNLVVYTTPPITFVRPILYIKRKDKAITYLMLKDIFPQNAIDIGIMHKNGIMAPLYYYFRYKEKKLYDISDYIGCMSPANIAYIKENNPKIDSSKLCIFPNSIYVKDLCCSYDEKIAIRDKYNIPKEKKVFVYGGNLGKPQGVPFILECLKAAKEANAFFLIVGNGTEFHIINDYLNTTRQKNVKLLKGLPKNDYDQLVSACDVGLLYLDHRFTIPNFPSRILSYMQAHLPILAITDANTDVGQIIEKGDFGWWCESNSAEEFMEKIEKALAADLKKMGDNGYEYLKIHYNVEINCKKMLDDIAKQ